MFDKETALAQFEQHRVDIVMRVFNDQRPQGVATLRLLPAFRNSLRAPAATAVQNQGRSLLIAARRFIPLPPIFQYTMHRF
jgi:hypothetical protein